MAFLGVFLEWRVKELTSYPIWTIKRFVVLFALLSFIFWGDIFFLLEFIDSMSECTLISKAAILIKIPITTHLQNENDKVTSVLYLSLYDGISWWVSSEYYWSFWFIWDCGINCTSDNNFKLEMKSCEPKRGSE